MGLTLSDLQPTPEPEPEPKGSDAVTYGRYPYADGDTTVIGPECFASDDGEVVCWKGVNYTRQLEPKENLDAAD